jgi:hypothetical protein
MWQHESQSVTQSGVGMGKSTLLRLFVLWLLGSDPNEAIIWVGATQKQPRASLGTMQALIESPRFRSRLHHVFPNLRPGRIWRSTEFDIVRPTRPGDATSSVSVYGAYAESVLGSRGTTLIFDDLCTFTNTLTSTNRTKMIEWLATVFTRMTLDKLRIIASGNVWHREDALMDMVRKGFKHIITPAYTIDENGERVPTAPGALSLKKIAELEKQIGAFAAVRMLQCRLVATDQGIFRSVHFMRALDAGRGEPFRPDRVAGACFTGVDLAYRKKQTAALTSMVTCMVLDDGRRQIVDVRSGRWDSAEQRQNLREIWLRYNPIIGVESNGAQSLVMELMSEILAIPLLEKNTGINKYDMSTGIASLANEVEQGFWVFPCPRHPTLDESHGYIEPSPQQIGGDWSLEAKAGQPHQEIQELINEALAFDPNQHPGDRLMAWWICARTLRESAAGALLGQPSLPELPAFDVMAR